MIKRINKDTKKEYQYKDKPTSEDLPKNKDKIFLRYTIWAKIFSISKNTKSTIFFGRGGFKFIFKFQVQ